MEGLFWTGEAYRFLIPTAFNGLLTSLLTPTRPILPHLLQGILLADGSCPVWFSLIPYSIVPAFPPSFRINN